MEQCQRQKQEELRYLPEYMELPEMENELHQCGGDGERATVDGSNAHIVAKDLELNNNSDSDSEAMNGFMTPMLSKFKIRALFHVEFQSAGLEDTIYDNSFDFNKVTVKAEGAPRSSLFRTLIVISPVRRLPVSSLQHIFKQVRFQ